MHIDFLTEVALVAFAAFGFGLVFEKIKQPAVLGYIIAGIILGPSTLGLVENREHVQALAELGILLLLFLIGMELNLREFKKVWHISMFCTLLQIGGSLIVILGFGKLLNWPFGLSATLACAVALSSTAVAIKMLESIDELYTQTGRIAVGVLIAQDLAIVPMILVLRSLALESFDQFIIVKVSISLGLLAILIWYFSRQKQISFPFLHIAIGNKDLTPLAALVFCFGTAAISGLIGFSAAYGAFLGGLILGNSSDRHTLINATMPIQSTLLMVFFLSIGLLMDLQFILKNFWKVLVLLSFITIGKTFVNVSILHILQQPWSRAFLAGLILAQMGEFSFLLATISSEVKLIDNDGERLIISIAALSLAISPFWMAAARRLHDQVPRRIKTFKQLLNTVWGKEIGAVGTALNSTKKAYSKAVDVIAEKRKSRENKDKEKPEEDA